MARVRVGALEFEKNVFRPKKMPQTIWLTTDQMAKILELAGQLGVAPNVACSMLISKALEAAEVGQWTPFSIVEKPVEKVVERKVEVEKFMCPYCYTGFNSLSDLRCHLDEGCRRQAERGAAMR